MAFVAATILTAGEAVPTLEFGGATTGITFQATPFIQWSIVEPAARLIHLRARLYLQSKGSATGSAVIRALPYTAGAGASTPVPISISALAADTRYEALIIAGASSIALYKQDGTGSRTAMTDADFTNGTLIDLSVLYRAA